MEIQLNQSLNFSGGRAAISRLMKAYGVTKRKELGVRLDVPVGTFSTWCKRDFFPADLIIRCAIETGARLNYLVCGQEPIWDKSSDLKYFNAIRVENGQAFIIDNKPLFLPYLPNLDSRESYDKVFCVVEDNKTYFATSDYGNLVDGDYFVIVENSHLIRYITVLPAGKIRVDGGKFSFECELSDIDVVGKVILKMEKL
ncbi:phage repressor protein CI [Rodentibacter haemolyticus]|uniref:Phage repressor protein CI n=1 Tax=Rodentibacter haemolyticus TaxID=2778911 RepID=A0ABX6V465_9PAST|nr:phage repressor protein CI [Rodentibacter haemolyticus]QPB43041.1 phage repressor protein CI [Rodentibacter haemolyticus]